MRFSTLALVLTAMVSPLAFGQSADFGLQAGFSLPGGDVGKSASGGALSFGAQCRIDMKGGHAIVPRLDSVKFTGTRNFDGLDVDAEQNILSIGADYNYYFSRKVGQGFYLGGGLGFLQKKETYTLPPWYEDPSETKSRFYIALGLGGAVNRHVNLFARFQFFGDERKEDEYNSTTGNYEARYGLSIVSTFGVEFHF